MNQTFKLFNKKHEIVFQENFNPRMFNFMKLLKKAEKKGINKNDIDINYSITQLNKSTMYQYKFFIKKILLVEDDPTSNLTYKRLLSNLGHYVESFHSATEALNNLDQKPYFYDILLTDNLLVNESGIDLGKKAKLMNYQLKVYVMTSDMSSLSNKKLFEEKSDKFLINGAIAKSPSGDHIQDWIGYGQRERKAA